MKILLLGPNGQVGWELQRSLAPLGELVPLDRQGLPPVMASEAKPSTPASALTGDLTDLDGLARTLQSLRPDVIVNAAAHTAVDKAESEPERAHIINASAPAVLAQTAKASGALLVHYSTDYVFGGSGTTPWTEDAPTGPLNVYGQSKLAGERAIQASGCRHLIFRTSWVFAARGGNFAKTMLRLAAEREELKVIADQTGAPTGADLLADVTALLLHRLQLRPELGGTYHCAAAGQTSWHGYARHVIEWARAHGQTLKVAPEAVRAIPTSGYPTPAQRPLNSRLDTFKLRHAFGLHLPPWQHGVERMLAEIHPA